MTFLRPDMAREAQDYVFITEAFSLHRAVSLHVDGEGNELPVDFVPLTEIERVRIRHQHNLSAAIALLHQPTAHAILQLHSSSEVSNRPCFKWNILRVQKVGVQEERRMGDYQVVFRHHLSQHVQL